MKGRTALLQKDKNKGNIASNYRPITCLSLIWKLLWCVIAGHIYGNLDQQKLLPDLFGEAENIKTLLVNSMDEWRVMLCAGN